MEDFRQDQQITPFKSQLIRLLDLFSLSDSLGLIV